MFINKPNSEDKIDEKYLNINVLKTTKEKKMEHKRKTKSKNPFTALVFVSGETAGKVKSLLTGKKGERMKLYQKIFEIGVDALKLKLKKKGERKSSPKKIL